MKLVLGVVAIAAALIFLAWPNVAAEQRRLRQAEQDAAALRMAEEQYFSAHQRYLAVPPDENLRVLGFAPQLVGWAHYEVRLDGDRKATVIVEGQFGDDSGARRFTKELP